MKRSRFTEEQIVGVLKEQEAGQKTADVCRKHGISEGTFYKWKAKYGGLEVSDARRLWRRGKWVPPAGRRRLRGRRGAARAVWHSSRTSRSCR